MKLDRARLLTLVFMVVAFIQFGYLLAGFASLPAFYSKVVSQTVEAKTLAGTAITSNAMIAEQAAVRHLSLPGYAVYRLLSNSLLALVTAAVAALIIQRSRWQWYPLFTACMLLFLGQAALSEQIAVAGVIPLKLYGANDIFWFLPLLFIFLFPNGKAVPRGMGWIVIGLVAYHFLIQAATVAAYFAPGLAARANLPEWGSPVFMLPVLLNFLIVLVCQVVRYRRISTLVERQQAKWFVYGFGVAAALTIASLLGGNGEGYFGDLAAAALHFPLAIALPIAILRYRLFDIDLIIRKTLVYSVVTATLALVYFGGVLVLQELFSSLEVGQSPAALVLSTLAIAALFSPLRRRVQEAVDRRFYRRKYDAEQSLEKFTAGAREEVDVERLSAALVNVIGETVQPRRISLWIEDPKNRGS